MFIEIESLETIFHKYDIISDLPDSLKSCFLVTSFTNGSAAARVGVKLHDMVLFPGNELAASQQPTFAMLGKKDMAFLVHHEDKSFTSLSIMRYCILTELIESHVSLPDDIIYNNVNKPLQFKDISSLQKYHDIIYSEVNVSFQDQKLEKDSLAYGADTPPSSLSIAMAIMMHWFYERCSKGSVQGYNFKPWVTQSFTAARTLDIILGGIFMKTSNYTPSPEDLACHDDIFEHLHVKHNSTITTTNVKENLVWVPLLDIVHKWS